MKFERLLLENIGPFKGLHTIDLASTPDKPIILIGGKNGRGKTTIMDAFQFALFGRSATLGKKVKQTWDTYISELINNSESTNKAKIVLELSFNDEGIERNVSIERHLLRDGKESIDSMLVFLDGVQSDDLQESWVSFIDGLMPIQVAKLFLFDGEQVSKLVDGQNASETIRIGINSLLGLNIVDKLEEDLNALSRREKHFVLDEKTQTQLEFIKNNIEDLDKDIAIKKEEIILFTKNLETSEANFKLVEEDYLSLGGELLQNKNQYIKDKEDVDLRLKEYQDELRSIISNLFPLLMLNDNLGKILSQERIQSEISILAKVHHVFVERDRKLIDYLRETTCLKKLDIQVIQDWLIESYKGLKSKNSEEMPDSAALSQEGLDSLSALFNVMIPACSLQLTELAEKIKVAKDQCEKYDLLVSKIPDSETLEIILLKKKEVNLKKAEAASLIERTVGELHALEAQRLKKDKEYTDHLDRYVESNIENNKKLRHLDHIQRALETARTFKKELVKKNLHTIEKNILQAFKSILSKRDLISMLKIDPETYEITLFDNMGRPFSASRLSAAECQIFAISIVWGLSMACKYRLPVLIDTPLGKLDVDNKRSLLVNYFPLASDQVIILSTDTEIADEHFTLIKERISKAYTLQYNDATYSSELLPHRYFNSEYLLELKQ